MQGLKSTQYHGSMRVERADLVDHSASCPICLAPGERPVVHRLQEDPPVELLRCPACGACSAAMMPSAELLERYYARYYDGSAQMATFHDVDKLALHVWRAIDPARLPERLRILDFGGGEGLLSKSVARLHRAARPGGSSEITLVDFQPAQAQSAEAWSLRQVRTLEEARERYQLVLASSILEHVPELHAVLRDLFARVARPGFFYARTPYIEPFLRFSKGIDVTYPGHVHDMGDRFWGGVARTFALEQVTLVASRPSPVETRFKSAPLRTLAAHVLKLPAHIEGRLLGGAERRRLWTLVGGWEVVLRFDPEGEA